MIISHIALTPNMKPGFATSVDSVMESYIMELIAVAKKPGMISFATGLPDKNLFAVDKLKEAANDVFDSGDVTNSLQYGVTAGLPSLRERIAKRCNKVLGMHTDAKHIFITNGSQECFDLMGKMFIDRGDKIAVENPGYLGALQSFSVYGPEFLGIDLNENGPDMESLKKVLAQNPKFCYMIPNYQNPSGMSYSADARKQVAELFSESDTVILEDDAYGELGYDGRIGPAVSSMVDESVITGSFSKFISPAMRIGWMAVPDSMVSTVSTFVEAGCLHSGSLSQCILDRFLEHNDLDDFLVPVRAEYKRKKQLFLDLMEEHIPEEMSWNDPKGGMFVWLKAPEGFDAMKIYQSAMEKGLVIMPGKPFHVRGGENTIRLNYATAGDEDIKKGMVILGSACRESLR